MILIMAIVILSRLPASQGRRRRDFGATEVKTAAVSGWVRGRLCASGMVVGDQGLAAADS
jgi:hypothetical protein